MWKGVLNMELREFLLYTPGEFSDIISCYQIANGIAEEKEPVKQDYIPDWG